MIEKGAVARLIAGVCVIFLTSSCVKYHDIIGPEVPQAETIEDELQLRYHYLRSKTAYDEFQTLAAFDVLWFSEKVAKKYCDAYATRRGLNEQQRERLHDDYAKKLKKSHIFYVLADIREARMHDNLNDKDALWLPRLELYDTGGKNPELDLEQKPFKHMKATYIKEVDLEPELQALFGTRYRCFKPVKAAYRVVFGSEQSEPKEPKGGDDGYEQLEQLDQSERADGHDIVPVLVMSSPYHSCDFEWNLKNLKEKKLFKDEDFYWS